MNKQFKNKDINKINNFLQITDGTLFKNMDYPDDIYINYNLIDLHVKKFMDIGVLSFNTEKEYYNCIFNYMVVDKGTVSFHSSKSNEKFIFKMEEYSLECIFIDKEEKEYEVCNFNLSFQNINRLLFSSYNEIKKNEIQTFNKVFKPGYIEIPYNDNVFISTIIDIML